MFSKTDIESYFVNEKRGGLTFLWIGALAIVAAALLLILLPTNFHKGVGVPLIVFGILFSAVGFFVYRKSDNDRVRNVYAYDMDPSALKKELSRMNMVTRNFVILRYAWIFFFLTGAALYIYFIRDFSNDFWRGFGVGLAVMSFAGLVGDHYGNLRARVYLRGLSSFFKKDGP